MSYIYNTAHTHTHTFHLDCVLRIIATNIDWPLGTRLNLKIADYEVPADVASQRSLLICDMFLCLNLSAKTVKLISSRWVQYGDAPGWEARYFCSCCFNASCGGHTTHCTPFWWSSASLMMPSTFVSWSHHFLTIYFHVWGKCVKLFIFFCRTFPCRGFWPQKALAVALGSHVNLLAVVFWAPPSSSMPVTREAGS